MEMLLALSGYLIIPLAIALIFKGFKIKSVYITYLICASIIYFYPELISAIYYGIYPERIPLSKEGFNCGTGAALMEMVNIFVLVPGTLLVQALFNYLFSRSFFYTSTYHEKTHS